MTTSPFSDTANFAEARRVVPIESANLRKLAKKYVADWLKYGTPTAVLRLNHRMTPELIKILREEFRKQGINW